MQTIKRLSLSFFALLTITVAIAQQLVGNAPSQVAVGEQFRLTYTINTQNVSGFRAGKIPDELEVLMGPSQSSQSSFQMVNGHTSSSSSVTFTYIVCANKPGTFTIPPAHITVNGKATQSNALNIKVSGTAQSNHGNNSHGGSSNDYEIRDAGSRISGSDLFIKVSANKKRIHEQEPVLLTYKVYTLVGLTQLRGEMPDMKGFHSQEIPLPREKQFRVEMLNGRPYKTVTWQQWVVFPQMTGKLDIPSITFEGMVVQQNRDVDPFEAFFNGGSGYVEVKKKIVAPGLTLQVDPLPSRPANFSGGVGRFSITAQISAKEVKANDPFSIRIIVSGTGNLKLIKQPVVNFPKDFDKYDAKITDKTKITANGVEGSMVYDIMAVPRHQGSYEIPPVEFTYYDTHANAYKTIRSEGFKIDVAKGNGNSNVTDYSQSVEQLNKDIRFIKTGEVEMRDINDFFFGSTSYIMLLAVMLLAFISLFVIFRQRAINNANLGMKRGKKANKVATRRLHAASKLMTQNRTDAFYDEVMRALWGYVGDKLNMPVESLSRENIQLRLSERDVDEETISKFIKAIDECEFERYAPGDAKGNMNKTFEAAMTAIMDIEDKMKKKRKSPVSKVFILIVLMMMTGSTFASAMPTKANADQAYKKEQYQQAIADYESLLKKGANADIYYNLGNAYYRTNNLTRAIINYERAALLSPGDADIRFNLQLARSKTIDKITPESEMFFFNWYRQVVNMTSVDGWATTALIALAIAIVCALSYLFSERIVLRKTGFFGALLMIFIFVIANIMAHQQKSKLINRTGAIITASSVQIKSTPSKNGTDLFNLHEGTRVDIIDNSMKEWKEIRIADGKSGWIETSKMETI
ncbi:MAG: BatD family protein [Prevotella sp.]